MSYHEPYENLSASVREAHRALLSLIEELQAVDWYNQRADQATHDELKKILVHNRDEEIEHAAMCLEWLRREMPEFDEALRAYLFTEKSIVAIEEADTGEESGSGTGSLNIGKFRKGAEQ